MTIAVTPGKSWRWARRLTQTLTLLVIVTAPLLGGWQRLDRGEMATWDNPGWELPRATRDRLPLGERPKQAYRALELVGGGSAVSYVSIPAIDPVAGIAAMTSGRWSLHFAIALLLPLLLAAFAGRMFCGWLCPFGTLSRVAQAVLRRLPVRPPRYRIPTQRPVRWAVLAATIVASALGVQLLLIYLLPHVLVQQSVYAMWLLGGGGAAAGALIGLLIAGVAFGPTLYCATVCPTGAALSACGHLRVARLSLADRSRCGRHCNLCDRACWLGLQPSSGDPGPDCDLCGRCVPVCPQDNLRVVLERPRRRHLPVVAATIMLASMLAKPAMATPARASQKPHLLLNGQRSLGEVSVGISIVDLTGVKLDADARERLRGAELTVTVARGPRREADARGILPSREIYRGPLHVVISDASGRELTTLRFTGPTSPRSTPNRTLYRQRVDVELRPGDRIDIAPIAGWLPAGLRWRIPHHGTSHQAPGLLLVIVATALAYAGLLSLALLKRTQPPSGGTNSDSATPRHTRTAPSVVS